MSVFSSKADANLPVLTKFYQLEVEPEQFYQKNTSHQSVKDNELYRFFGMDGIHAQYPGYESSGYDGRDFLEDLSEFHRSVRFLMEALADDSELMGVYLVNIKQFMDAFFKTGISITISVDEVSPMLLEKDIAVSISPDSKIELGDHKNEPLFVEKFKARQIQFTTKKTVQNPIMRRLLEELSEVLANHTPHSRSIIRCAECNSPFVLSRIGQTFCSHRCAARAGERRRYQARQARLY